METKKPILLNAIRVFYLKKFLSLFKLLCLANYRFLQKQNAIVTE